MQSFSVASRFPTRRRAMQACVACRMRKTRCDAVQPRCGYCALQNLECVYRDSQQPRIDYGTQVLLERIQLLEDRLLTSGAGQGLGHETGADAGRTPAAEQSSQPPPPPSSSQESAGDLEMGDVQQTLWHTANANHVYTWPVIRQLLSEVPGTAGMLGVDATDVFFRLSARVRARETPAESWRLYPPGGDDDGATRNRELIRLYFAEVTAFFPLLSSSDLHGIHEAVISQDVEASRGNAMSGSQPGSQPEAEPVAAADYALLLLVLALASFMASGDNKISIGHRDSTQTSEAEYEGFWLRAKLLLGSIADDMSLAAAQCTMLASIYSGARGRIHEAFHWSHAAAVKCEALTRVYMREEGSRPPEEFIRLYWVAFIFESDFVSEISAISPSGISHFEERIPYPTLKAATENPAHSQHEELVAFQITTNASIRRFLNRVNSAVYNAKEQQRRQRHGWTDHAAWLLRISRDLWAHHDAVYRNLPGFLLTSTEEAQSTLASPSGGSINWSAGSPTARIEGLAPRGNNVWNIARLKGRYHAGQYIIHRPFVEYAVLNANDGFGMEPSREQILDGCRMCFQGCVGFIRVFDKEPANSITCLFATGMVTFTMTMILLVATVLPLFRDVIPSEVEESIVAGVRNLRRCSVSVHEFAWHLEVLERLDTARKLRLGRTDTMQ